VVPILRQFRIQHERRKVLHFNVTANPTAIWVIQQMREAFPLRQALAIC
jgi:putative transposase